VQIERRGRFFLDPLLGLRFRFPHLFPSPLTKRVLVGHVSKFRKAAFYKISQSADGYPHVISKSDKKRRHKLDQPSIVHGDQIHSWYDAGTHCVRLNSIELNSCDSVAFPGGSSALAGLHGVSEIAGDS
jgi:hypothetical protein